MPRVKKFEKKYNQEKIDKYIQSIESELEELDYNDPKDKRKIALREQKYRISRQVYSQLKGTGINKTH